MPDGIFQILKLSALKIISRMKAYNYLYRIGAMDFIIECFGALHTTGPLYIVDSIDDFIANNYSENL